MDHVALYRLYRPMNFDEIVEQSHAVAALRQSVISGKIGHAYLFCGTRGTGKTSIAKVFSRAINCKNPVNGNPCNECEICKGVIDGSLLDVIEMDAASNNSVDNIRRICDEVMFMPAKAKYKVYIIDEVHMLSTGAFNALLKTLEEPPAHAVFLLATTEPHRIPATILSRCQRYDFRRISNASIVERLSFIAEKQNINIEKDALSAIATIGDGALRDSVSLLDQVSTTSAGKTITRDDILRITGVVDESFLNKFATALLEGRAADLLPLCRELTMDGRDLIRFTLDLAQYFRNILVTQVSASPSTLIESTSSAIAAMTELGRRTDTTSILFFISKLSDLAGELKWSPSARTSFEIMMLRLASRGNKILPAVVKPVEKAAVSEVPPVAAVKDEPKAEEKTDEKAEEKVVEKSPLAPIAQAAPAPVPTPPSPFANKTPKAPEPSIPAIAKAPAQEIPVVEKIVPEPSIPPIAEPPKTKTPEKAPEDDIPEVMAPPPVLDDISTPPPPAEDDYLAPPPPLEDAPLPVEIEVPVPEETPDAAELSKTAPSSPNLHKAFASKHVTEGSATNLVKATHQPEVRAPQIPRDIVVPDGQDAPSKEAAPVSNLQQVMHRTGDSDFAAAGKEFTEFLKKNYPFDYMYMSQGKLTWNNQTVYFIVPDSYADMLKSVENEPIIITNLLKISQVFEPSLIHAKIVTNAVYGASVSDPDPEVQPESVVSSPPKWAVDARDAANRHGVPVIDVENM